MRDNKKTRTLIGSRLGKVVEAFPNKTTAAKAAGITLQQLNKWIKGEAKIPLEGLIAILNSKYSNKDLLWLTTGNSSENTHKLSTDSDFLTINPKQEQTFQDRIEILIEVCSGSAQLAERAGLSRRVIDKYRYGESEPSLTRLIALANAGGKSVEWLATGKTSPITHERPIDKEFKTLPRHNAHSDDTGISNRIRQCAKIVGSGDSLARKTGISRSTIENYVTGKTDPKATNISKIAEIAGVTCDWLINGSDDLNHIHQRVRMEDDPIFEEVSAWVMEFIIENKYQANAAHFGKLLVRCYKATLNHKTSNPKITNAELRQFLETILFASISIGNLK